MQYMSACLGHWTCWLGGSKEDGTRVRAGSWWESEEGVKGRVGGDGEAAFMMALRMRYSPAAERIQYLESEFYRALHPMATAGVCCVHRFCIISPSSQDQDETIFTAIAVKCSAS
jgi:hypothetical protein